VQKSYEAIRKLVDSHVNWISKLNEAQFRTEFLDKILPNLGYFFIPESETPAQSKKRPDYLVFSSEKIKPIKRRS